VPIYEYECEICSFKFDLLKKVGENGGASCPRCQGYSHRLFSSVPFIFKGGRWVGKSGSTSKDDQPKDKDINKAENDKNRDKSENSTNLK
jgi:putative FmdB family regulatory protein